MSGPDGTVLRPMAMFPLGTVLFPSLPLPLHVFESRYRALVADCLRNTQQFGVVLIERGFEVGGGDQRFGVGTVARITTAGELPDGRWLLEAVGTHRIRIVTWLPDDPYPVALVEDREEEGVGDLERFREALAGAERSVRRTLTLKEELAEPAVPADIELSSDAAARAWQLAAIAPIGPLDHQRLLEVDDPIARLSLLTRLADEEAGMLAHRLSGG